MTHQDAVNNMAVEHYLLGELSGEGRDRFEEHLFDCELCAADLKAGVLLIEGVRTELKATEGMRIVSSSPQKRQKPKLAWLWQPWIMGPALAACLAIIVYQSAFLMPTLRGQAALSQQASLVEPLTLANAGARGGTLPEIDAPKQGVYLLSVDIPPAPDAASYRCSLYDPSGKLAWHVDLTARQARDAVTIQVPMMTAHEGINELRVESVSSAEASGGTLVVLANYKFQLSFTK